jgi:hypothetical protein
VAVVGFLPLRGILIGAGGALPGVHALEQGHALPLPLLLHGCLQYRLLLRVRAQERARRVLVYFLLLRHGWQSPLVSWRASMRGVIVPSPLARTRHLARTLGYHRTPTVAAESMLVASP